MNQKIIELLPPELIQIGKLMFQGTMEEVNSEGAVAMKKDLEVIGEDEEDPEDDVPQPSKLATKKY
jgi:hypothetical protein